MSVDVLAIGAHPDDIEAGAGGVVIALARQGYRVGALDLSRGELGSRGSVAERDEEARQAARVLGVAERLNAGLPDGGIANTPEQQKAVVRHIRHFQPRIILAPMNHDRHPDHNAAHDLVRDANFFAGLTEFDAPPPPHRADIVYGYRVHGASAVPEIVIDISEVFEQKMEAMAAYRSQFHNPDYDGPATYVASKEFWDSVRTRASYWGHRIGVEYGEPLFASLPIGLTTPPGLQE